VHYSCTTAVGHDATCDLRLVTLQYMLEFFQATICFNLPPVRCCGRKDVCKCDSHTCLPKWWTTRGDSARPASSTGLSKRGDTLFQKLFIPTFQPLHTLLSESFSPSQQLSLSGIVKLKVVPFPGSDFTHISPP